MLAHLKIFRAGRGREKKLRAGGVTVKVPELWEWNYPFPFPFPNSQMSFPLTSVESRFDKKRLVELQRRISGIHILNQLA